MAMRGWIRCRARCSGTVLGMTAAAIASCSSSSSTAPQRVLIPIRQLVVPDSVANNGVLPVDVTVVYGGCTSFTGVSFTRAPDHVTVTAWGEGPTGPGIACPANIANATVHIDVPGPWDVGKLTVTAQEPGTSSPIVHEVQVR